MKESYLPEIEMPEVVEEAPEEHPLGNIKVEIQDAEQCENDLEIVEDEPVEIEPPLETRKRLDTDKVFKKKTAKAEKQEKLEKDIAEAKIINEEAQAKQAKGKKIRKPIVKKKKPIVEFEEEEEIIEEEEDEEAEEYEEEEEEEAPPPTPAPRPVAVYKTGPKRGQPKPKKVLTAKQFEALQNGRKKRDARNKVRKAEEAEVKGAVRVRKPNKEDVFAHPADLQKVMLDTIVAYDKQKKTMKEKRKAEKVIEETQKKKDDNLNRTIQRALNPNDADYWGDCFNITY